MTPEEKKLELDSETPDHDYEEHEATYIQFTRLLKYVMLAFPFFFAFLMYWTY
ncbi:MAG: hypothetical protein JWL62_2441 [Hyphomicrobiales bacterium]|nr:hypothetical protein [Hyphomicrobiales bacterium]